MAKGIRYDSNNSGGYWWLTDDHWCALEKDGWIVDWEKNERDYFATGAFLPDVSLRVAIARWEDVTGLDASEEGCYCCGQPHNFYEDVQR